jgi:hypothetical protein
MPQRKGEKPKKAPAEIDRLEWCFKDCPNDELLDCWQYEFSREVDWLKSAVARRRGPITTKYDAKVHVDTLSEFAQGAFCSFLLMPQWPDEPYLSISREERHNRIMWTRRSELLRWTSRSELLRWTSRSELSQAAALLADTPVLLKSPLPSEIEEKILANSLVPFEVPKGIEEQLADCLQNVGGLPRPRVRSENNLTELALLQIDWTLPDSELIRAFRAYIKEFRPAVPNSLPIRNTGKKVPDSIRRRELDQLGRFRLMRANGENVELARATGHLSSGNPNPWYQARRAVKKMLENAETQIVPRLSRVELEDFTTLSTPSKR